MSRLRPYLAFMRASFSMNLAYRMHIVFWIFSDFIQIGLMLLVWVAVYQNSDSALIYGFSLNQILIYNLIVNMSASFTRMNPVWDIAEDYYDGRVAMSLIKPTRYITQIFFQNLGSNIFGNILISLPLSIALVVLGINHQIDITLLSLALYVLSLGMGLFISFYANFIFANLVFYTDATFGMFQLNEAIVRIFSGSLIPLVFFPGWLKLIADFLPYGSIQYIPTMILMGRITGTEIVLRMLIQLAWVLGLALSAHMLWNHSLRRMKVHGG